MTAGFDDPRVRAALTAYVTAAAALDEAAADGADARTLLDRAEAKAVTGMALKQRLLEQGWAAPAAQRSAT